MVTCCIRLLVSLVGIICRRFAMFLGCQANSKAFLAMGVLQGLVCWRPQCQVQFEALRNNAEAFVHV